MQFLDRLNILRQIGLSTKIRHDNSRKFKYQNHANLLGILLVTHVVPSDTRFTVYEFSMWTVVLKQF
jgi:hypothetical protein